MGFDCAKGADMGLNSQYHYNNNEIVYAPVHYEHKSNGHHHEEAAADKAKDYDNCCHGYTKIKSYWKKPGIKCWLNSIFQHLILNKVASIL